MDKLFSDILKRNSENENHDESKAEEIVRHFVRAINTGIEIKDSEGFFKAIPIAKGEIEILYGVDPDEFIDPFIDLYNKIDSILQIAINGNIIGILSTTLDISMSYATMAALAGLQYGYHIRVAERQWVKEEYEFGNGSITLNGVLIPFKMT